MLFRSYPTGRPILNPHYQSDHWNYGLLAETVDHLVVQTQLYCHANTTSFASAVTKVLGQYAAASASGAPTFQITLGNNLTITPNQVSPSQAYNCTHVLTQDGLRTLYVWWGTGANSDLLTFLKDIGRSKR